MPQAAVQVRGLTEFRRELRKLEEPRGWTRELAAGNRTIARRLEPYAQALARSDGGQPRHFASAIRGYGSAQKASLGIQTAGRGQRNWGANAAFWGAKDNVTGWNRSDTPNLKVPWVGSTWDVAPGQGPRALVDAVVADTPWVVSTYGDMVGDLAKRAFPD